MAEESPALVEALERVRSSILTPTRLRRAVAAGRRRGESVPWRRAELRYVELKSGRSLQLTTYDDSRATVQNAPARSAQAADLVDRILGLPFAHWRVETTDSVLQVRVTKKGRAMVHVQTLDQPLSVDHSHDRQKPRMLTPDHPVLRAVGITDREGRVKPSRQAKYRQVDEFLRLLASAVDSALASGRIPRPTVARPLRIVDLGCGNAYLTFAAIAYLLDVRREPARMVGVDLRPQARHRNSDLATATGLADHLTFQESAIATAELTEPPDVVLSLHACDTATDQSLARAIQWRTPVVLAAPCCHHDLQTQLSRVRTPAPYGLLASDGILRERFADVLTDAFRAAILRLHGYRVDAVQFVESHHTPRNTLLRAIRTNAPPSRSLQRDYANLTEAWGVEPALARMLAESSQTTAEASNDERARHHVS
ncbi:class I SAM-dependent methyltransferase [Microlunatus sp. GCM10028923]|uniref:class I SAM-dependent methyltransferase n=1 Tax=Microlunatus sp. GCM10028923 TaxID=3273400 RepID=UPI003618ACA2